MLKRIANAVFTQLVPQLRELIATELERRHEKERKDVREMVREMEDVLEKLTLRAAREARRRTRDARAAAEPELVEGESGAGTAIAATEQHPGLPSNYKQQLRMQYGHMLTGGRR